MLIRLVAFGLMVVSAMNLWLYWLKVSHSREPLDKLAVAWRCFYLSVPIVVGLALAIKASAIAARLTEHFEE